MSHHLKVEIMQIEKALINYHVLVLKLSLKVRSPQFVFSAYNQSLTAQ